MGQGLQSLLTSLGLVCLLLSEAQAGESIAVVARTASAKGALSKTLQADFVKGATQVLLSKKFKKVVRRKAAFQNCENAACFGRVAGRLKVQRIVILSTELIRKGLFGIGSKCHLTYELRSAVGHLLTKKEGNAACKKDSLRKLFSDLSADLKPRKKPAGSKPKVSRAMVKACGATQAEAQNKLNDKILRANGLAADSGQIAFNQLKIQTGKGGKTCLSQDLGQLRQSLSPLMATVTACAGALPQTRAARIQATRECLAKLSQAELLISVLKNRLNSDELAHLDTLSSLRAKLMSARERVSKKFRACGATKREALESLSKNISSKVSDRFDSVSTAGRAGELEEISARTTVQSHVQLQNIKWDESGDTYCAIQHYDDLMNATLARLERVNTCEDRFPEDPELKLRMVSACLSDIRFVSELYPLFWADMSEAQKTIAGKLTTLAARLEHLGGKILLQSIQVDVLWDNASLLIDGIPQDAGAALPWPAGEIQVEIKGPQLCTFKTVVALKEKQHLVLKPDLSERGYPKIQFNLTQANAELMVDGAPASSGQLMTFNKCEGTINYRVSLPDGESLSDEIELEPGMNETLKLRVLTKKERNRLRQVAESFETAKLLTGTYSASYPISSKLTTPEFLQDFRVDFTTGSGALRFGGGASYGFGGDRVHLFEAYGILIAQLTNLDNGPLNLTEALALIPFIGVDLGFGHHNIETKLSSDRGDFGDFLNSHVIARGHAGVMFAPQEQVAVRLHFSHNLTMERPLSLNLGISVRLP